MRPVAKMLGARACVYACALVAIGCTPSASTKTGDPPATCTRSGDSCTFSPGKLGVCTAPGDGRTSLVCQSLH